MARVYKAETICMNRRIAKVNLELLGYSKETSFQLQLAFITMLTTKNTALKSNLSQQFI